MASSRFPSVCNTCKWRKKACDKKLPSCTYCAKRAIVCHYPDSPSEAQPHRSHTTSNVIEAWKNNSSSITAVDNLAASARAHLLLIHSVSDHAYLLPLSGFPASKNSSFDSIVHKQVSRLLQMTGASMEAIEEQYPSAIHSSLPVVYKDQFVSYKHACSSFTPPSADLSILMLAASLLSFRRDDDTRSNLADQESVYLTVKMLYTQVQAMTGVSIPLLQSNILIAIFEYSSGRCQVALLSLTTCAAMLKACEMSIELQSEHERQSPALPRLEVVRWYFIVCERIVACELPQKTRLFALQFPDADTSLCEHPGVADWNKHSDDGMSETLRIRDVATPGRGLPGTIQACWLLDRIFQFIELSTPLQLSLSEAKALDADLRTFMNMSLELEANGGGCCGSIAVMVRGMLMYYAHIAQLSRNVTELSAMQDGSHMALQTTARIMVDVAQSRADGHCLTNIDEAIPTCRYAALAALSYLGEYKQEKDPSQLPTFSSNSKEVLKDLISALEKRWQAVDS